MEELPAHLRYLPPNTRVVMSVKLPALLDSFQVPPEARANLSRNLYRGFLSLDLPKGAQPAVTDLSSLTLAQPCCLTNEGLLLVRGKVNPELLAEQVRSQRKGVAEVRFDSDQPMPLFKESASLEGYAHLPFLSEVPVLDYIGKEVDAYFAAVDEETVAFTWSSAKTAEEREAANRKYWGHVLASRAPTAPLALPADLRALLAGLEGKDSVNMVALGDSLLPAAARERFAREHPQVAEEYSDLKYAVIGIRWGDEYVWTQTAAARDVETARRREGHARDTLGAIRALLRSISNDPKEKAVLEKLGQSIALTRQREKLTMVMRLKREEAQAAGPEKKE